MSTEQLQLAYAITEWYSVRQHIFSNDANTIEDGN